MHKVWLGMDWCFEVKESLASNMASCLLGCMFTGCLVKIDTQVLSRACRLILRRGHAIISDTNVNFEAESLTDSVLAVLMFSGLSGCLSARPSVDSGRSLTVCALLFASVAVKVMHNKDDRTFGIMFWVDLYFTYRGGCNE